MYDRLNDELVNTSSDLLIYLILLLLFERIILLIVFVSLILTLYVDWSWIPILTNDRYRRGSLEALNNWLLKLVS